MAASRTKRMVAVLAVVLGAGVAGVVEANLPPTHDKVATDWQEPGADPVGWSLASWDE